jgi:DNA-binding response OmpR family regulator
MATLSERAPAAERATTSVLVVEDEETIAEFLRIGLSYEGFQVAIAPDGSAALGQLESWPYELLILDTMLPDVDGFDVCRRIRERGNEIPIIMLTARTETPDRIAGLNLGADDYITKPFSFEELLARIRAVMRRRGTSREPKLLTAAGIVLDPEAHDVHVNGRELDLTPTEFALLELFLRQPRRVFTRETLLDRVWGFEYAGDTNVVEVHVSHLRRKLGDPAKRAIRTVYGVGYSLRTDDAEPVA